MTTEADRHYRGKIPPETTGPVDASDCESVTTPLELPKGGGA